MDDLVAHLGELRTLLAAGDEPALQKKLELAAQARRDWQKNRQTH
jgi:hypothetical protein